MYYINSEVKNLKLLAKTKKKDFCKNLLSETIFTT